MTKQEMEDFSVFCSEFKKWQGRFGLGDYDIAFKHEEVKDEFANITMDQGGMVATVRLNNEVPGDFADFVDVQRSAKHEAIHLLLFRLEERAVARFCTRDEISEIVEGLVHKLEGLIPELPAGG